MPIKLLLHICCGPCSTHVAEVLSKKHEIVGYFYNPNIFPYEEWLKRYEAFREVVKKCHSRATLRVVSRKEKSRRRWRDPARGGGGNPEKIFQDYFPKKPLVEEEWETEHQKFLEAAKNLENEPEGGKRCSVCFKLRLEEAARFAFESSCHSEQSEESRGSDLSADLSAEARPVRRLGLRSRSHFGEGGSLDEGGRAKEEVLTEAEATRENLWFATTLTIGRNKKAEIINSIGESAAQKYGIKFYAADFKKIPRPTSLFQKGGGKEGDLSGFWNSVKLSKEMELYRQKYCGCEFSCPNPSLI